MAYQYLIYEKVEGVAVVTINRPEVLNAVNDRVISELEDVFMVMDNDPEVHCVVLTGKGRAFVAGADISWEVNNKTMDENKHLTRCHKLFDKIEEFRTPVICAINGYALGGGLELAMCCDIRIIAETAKVGLPEINLASLPANGGTRRLAALVGPGRAKEMIFTGRHVKAHEAYEYGLVQEVVAPEELMNTVMAMAKKMAARAPRTLEYSKRSINYGCWADRKASGALEVSLRAELQETHDTQEAYTAFIEKREAGPFTGN